MKTRIIAFALICMLLIGCACMAEEARPRLDTADKIVYQITNGKYRVMDMEGQIVGEDSDEFPSDRVGDTAIYLANGRYGYVAKDGTVLVEPNYLEMPKFKDGFATVCKEDIDDRSIEDNYYGAPNFPSIYGVIDAYGDVVMPIEYEYAQVCNGGNYAIASVKGDDYWREGLFDLNKREMAIDPQYYALNDPHDGVLTACECTIKRESPNENSSGDEYTYQYGILNTQGEVLVPFEYNRIEYNDGFNAYTCYTENDELAKIYEIKDGTLVEKAD